MGILRDTIREVLSKGLRATNEEINQDAIAQGLISTKTPDPESAAATVRCRAGFEGLHAALTSDGPK